MDKAKVGDKILVVDAQLTEGKYKNGDVLTVAFLGQEAVMVREHDRAILHSEYTVLPDIKAGDTVRMIDKPWECELWGSFSRIRRLKYKEFIGKEHVVNFIIQPDDVTVYDISGNACADIGDYHVVPLALLRKVEPKTDGDINIVISGIENLKPAKHRYTAEQEREARELIGKIVAEMDAHTSLFFGYPHSNNDTKLCYMPQGGEFSDYIVRCSPNDEFSQTIGRMVALCKATGTPLPEWVKP